MLGEDEWCCGFPLLGAGLGDHLKGLVDHNIEAVKARGASTVVLACPSCYQMWREHYPAEVQILHVSQYLREVVRSGQLPLKQRVELLLQKPRYYRRGELIRQTDAMTFRA